MVLVPDIHQRAVYTWWYPGYLQTVHREAYTRKGYPPGYTGGHIQGIPLLALGS